MKRIIVWLLTGVLLLGLTGCGSAGSQISMTPKQSYTDYEGIEVRIDSLNWDQENGQTTLRVIWENKTTFDATFGASYEIERLEGDQWVSCAKKDDIAFIAIGYILNAGQTRTEQYNLTDHYDVASPGTYRFKSNCYVSDSTENSTPCELIAEFVVEQTVSTDNNKEVQWDAQYIRTDGYQEGAAYPKVQLIDSPADLTDYYTSRKDIFYLERRDTVSSDSSIGFLDACDRYDAAFFDHGFLVLVLLEDGSGSVRHEVRSVERAANGKLHVSIDRNVPEVGTCDMAQWHIILELSRDLLVETETDIQVSLDGKLAWNGAAVQPTKSEAPFLKPPEGKLITPNGEAPLQIGGYSWFYTLENGLEDAIIADQSVRPIQTDHLPAVTISSNYAETVYAPIPGGSAYAPTNSSGYLLKLDWEVQPTSVRYTCWPAADLQNSNFKEESVVSHPDASFYAKPGSYIYEITAHWEDTGAGFHGTAGYYVYIVEVNEEDPQTHTHQIASKAQTVEDPFIGYCGNTWTTLHIGEQEYSFMFGHSVTLTDILINLDYDSDKLCNCRCEYTVDTEFGLGYEINLTQGYARYENGQADLTQEQINQIAEIIKWAETTNCEYPLSR